MATQKGWSTELTHLIGGQIQRHRKARKWSTRRLAEECTQLGIDTPRDVIVDLEIGRRAHISVAELLVIAAALGVPPVLLICPVGDTEEIEVLPGQSRPAFRAVQWLSGEGTFPDPGQGAGTVIAATPQNCGPAWPLALYRAHDRAIEEEARALTHARGMDERAAVAATDAEREAFAAAADAQRSVAEGFRDRGEQLREEAREQGIVPPGLTMKLQIPLADS